MPEPIKTVHELSLHAEIFDPKFDSGLPMSDIASIYLGVPKTAAKKTFSEHTINLLEAIYQNEDEVLSATNIVTSQSNEKVFRAPKSISDYDLLHLKTEGLVSGQGRAVKFTDTARVALRDHWLKSKNTLLTNRVKTEFVHPSRNASTSKITRTATKKFTIAQFSGDVESVDAAPLQPQPEQKICGYCGQPGADTRPEHVGHRLPNVTDPGTPFVHLQCELNENERAHEELRKKMGHEELKQMMSTYAAKKSKFKKVDG